MGGPESSKGLPPSSRSFLFLENGWPKDSSSWPGLPWPHLSFPFLETDWPSFSQELPWGSQHRARTPTALPFRSISSGTFHFQYHFDMIGVLESPWGFFFFGTKNLSFFRVGKHRKVFVIATNLSPDLPTTGFLARCPDESNCLSGTSRLSRPSIGRGRLLSRAG
jgi:hypothetical protein